MNKAILIIGGILLVIASLIGVFFYGKMTGASEIEAKVINNTEVIRKIGKISTVETGGTARYHQSNVVEETGFMSTVQNTLFEKTIDVQAPFTATYGIDIAKGPTEISSDGKTIFVSLPEPEMTGFDLKSDSMTEMSERGWVSFQRDDTYVSAVRELTKSGRETALKNEVALTMSKAQTAELIKYLYLPLGKPVRVTFGGKVFELDSIKPILN